MHENLLKEALNAIPTGPRQYLTIDASGHCSFTTVRLNCVLKLSSD
jgi:hypothetical protein